MTVVWLSPVAGPISSVRSPATKVKILVEKWFEHYGAPKEVHSDKIVRIQSETGWYKRVLDVLNVHVTTVVPYTHTSDPMCERQNCVLQQNLRILTKQERT